MTEPVFVFHETPTLAAEVATARAAESAAQAATAAAKRDLLVALNQSALNVGAALITLDTIGASVAAGSTSSTVFGLELDATATGTGTVTITFFYGAAQVGPTVQVPFTAGPVHVSVNDFLVGLTASAAFTAKAQVTTGTGTVAVPSGGAHLYIMGTSLAAWRTPEVAAGIIGGPQGLAFSASGDLYVAGYDNHQIWRVAAPDYTASVFAGSGTAGHTNDTGTAAAFDRPSPLAFDASGNLYVGESAARIRKITPSGVVSDAYPGTAPFANVYDLTCDPSGNVYVVGWDVNVYKLTPDGVITTLATVPGGGLATIDYDTCSGDLFVTDATGRQLLRVTMAGVVTTLAALGTNPDGNPIFAAFDQSGVLNIACQNYQSNTPGMDTFLPHILRFNPLTGAWLAPIVLDLGWFTQPAGPQYLEQVLGIACSPTGDLVIDYQYSTRISTLVR